jgi:hypothetical protein
MIVTDADLERYMQRRHTIGYSSDLARDGLTLTLFRKALRAAGEVLAKPHHAFLRWTIRRLVRRNRQAGRQTSIDDAYLAEIIAIDIWTLIWPLFHSGLYLAAYLVAIHDGNVSPAGWAILAVAAGLSIYRAVDIFIVLLRLHFAERYVPHLSSRAVVGTLLQFVDLAMSFAIVYVILRLAVGREGFGGDDLLQTVVRPLYYSFATITTLGYGDIVARDWRIQLVVIAELVTGLTVIAVILQHVVAPRDTRSNAQERIGPEPPAGPQPAAASATAQRLYAQFIDRFRHDESYVKDIFRRFVPELRGSGPLLDVGSGRGEFLDLMKEEGITAYGVDTNSEFVERCRKRGLMVVASEWSSHMRSLQDRSLGAVFAAQFVEHLHAAELLDFLQLAAAKTRPGGLIVLETLTPCLNTLLKKFWVDITHIAPVNPDALAFFTSAVGYTDVRIDYYNEIEPPLEQPGDVPDPNVEKINALLFRPHYYAVVGRRAAG